jgi:hypothetical protein
MASSRKTFKSLSSAERTFIQEKQSSLTIDQLAYEVGTTVGVVKKVLAETATFIASEKDLAPKEVEPETIPAEQTATGTTASAHQPFVREEDGVTVMTAAAAQWADEVMKKNKGPNYVEANPDRIFQPRPGKPSR